MVSGIFILKAVFYKQTLYPKRELVDEIGDSLSIILGKRYKILEVHADEDMHPKLSDYLLDHIDILKDKVYDLSPLYYIENENGDLEPLSLCNMGNVGYKVKNYYILCDGVVIDTLTPTVLYDDDNDRVLKYLQEEYLSFK